MWKLLTKLLKKLRRRKEHSQTSIHQTLGHRDVRQEPYATSEEDILYPSETQLREMTTGNIKAVVDTAERQVLGHENEYPVAGDRFEGLHRYLATATDEEWEWIAQEVSKRLNKS